MEKLFLFKGLARDSNVDAETVREILEEFNEEDSPSNLQITELDLEKVKEKIEEILENIGLPYSEKAYDLVKSLKKDLGILEECAMKTQDPYHDKKNISFSKTYK